MQVVKEMKSAVELTRSLLPQCVTENQPNLIKVRITANKNHARLEPNFTSRPKPGTNQTQTDPNLNKYFPT